MKKDKELDKLIEQIESLLGVKGWKSVQTEINKVYSIQSEAIARDMIYLSII